MRSQRWLCAGVEDMAKTYAITNLIPNHFSEVKTRKEMMLTKTAKAVKERMIAEIQYWDFRAADLQQKEAAGKTNAKLNSKLAARRAEDLEARMQARLDEIEKEAGYFARILRRTGMDAKIQVVSCESQIGGGSLPLERMESRAVSIQPNGMSVAEMEEKMRHLEIPIIPRTVNDSICLDVRTIERKDYKMIASELTELLGQKEKEER